MWEAVVHVLQRVGTNRAETLGLAIPVSFRASVVRCAGASLQSQRQIVKACIPFYKEGCTMLGKPCLGCRRQHILDVGYWSHSDHVRTGDGVTWPVIH